MTSAIPILLEPRARVAIFIHGKGKLLIVALYLEEAKNTAMHSGVIFPNLK